ncbi:hypothetical protein L5515_000803 [Caenorhabditis briggsae]|uniref:Uncharacterized protein n=1 Tax=Caenorhabditis briggsae TaxID=6238 RepID=A0AAE9E2Y5_CAEBR|nr:hypothetical protein L5515_000803 [Caenorhabditis briggsae]
MLNVYFATAALQKCTAKVETPPRFPRNRFLGDNPFLGIGGVLNYFQGKLKRMDELTRISRNVFEEIERKFSWNRNIIVVLHPRSSKENEKECGNHLIAVINAVRNSIHIEQNESHPNTNLVQYIQSIPDSLPEDRVVYWNSRVFGEVLTMNRSKALKKLDSSDVLRPFKVCHTSGKFLNNYGPVKQFLDFSIDEHEVDHDSLKDALTEVLGGSMKFSLFQFVVKCVIDSQYCYHCLGLILNSLENSYLVSNKMMEFGFDWRTDYGETYKYSFWRLEYQLTQSKFAPEATFDNEWDSLSSTNFSKRHGEGRSTSFRQYSLDCPEMDDSFYDFDDPELCRARSSPTYGDDDQQEVDYEIEKSAPKRVAMNMHKRRSVKTNASQKGVEGGGEDPVPKKLPVELKQSASESPSPRRFMRSRSFLSKQITRSKKAQDVEKGDISKGERDGDVIIVTEEEILKTRKNMIIRRTVESGFRFFKDRESSLSLPNVMSVWSRNHHRMAVLGSIYGALQNFKPEFLKKDNGTVIEFESVYVEPTQEESPFNEESQEEIIIESDISSSFSPPHGELDTEKEASPEAPDHSFMVPRCESPIEEFDYFVKEERQFFSYAAEYAKYRRSPPRYKSQNQFQHIYGQLHNKDYDDVITID